MNFDQIMLRAKQALKVATDKEVSEMLGLSKTAMAERKRRGAFPEEKLRVLAAERPELNLDLDYILTGVASRNKYFNAIDEGEALAKRLSLKTPGRHKLAAELYVALVNEHSSHLDEIFDQFEMAMYSPEARNLEDSNFIMVPRYDVRASAGTGAVIHSETIVDHLAFKQDWVTQMGLSKKDLALIEVQGDSMEPTLAHGDLILIDLRESRLNANGIYAIQHMGSLFVKRIQIKFDGSVVIKSDNLNYEAETLTPAEAENLVVVGRVAWFGRQL